MRSSTALIAAAAAGSAIAADSFNALFFDHFDTQSLVAKSIGGDSDATTYVLGCPVGVDSNDCGLPFPIQYIGGPKTAVYSLERVDVEEEGDFSLNQFYDCSLAGTTVAACTATIDGPYLTNTAIIAGDGSTPPTSTFLTISGTDVADYFVSVQIVKETASILNYGTDAHEKPTSYGGAKEAKETGMVTSKAILPSQTGTAQSGISSVVSKASSAASDAAAASTSTGLAAQVTGLGALALAAVAGVIGVAAL